MVGSGSEARADGQSGELAATIAPLASGFAMPAAPAADAAAYGGGRMGGAGAMPVSGAMPGVGMPAGMGAPAVRYRDVESDREVAVETVQIVGNETLYKRGSQWFAASAKDVDLKRDADKVQTLERFGDEYFKLVAANTPAENAVLARQQAGEELVIKLRGQIYLIR